LVVESIDDTAHRGGFVVVARRVNKAEPMVLPTEFSHDVQDWLSRFQGMAAFWSNAAERVRSQEAQLPPDAETAIYGAGFYVRKLTEPIPIIVMYAAKIAPLPVGGAIIGAGVLLGMVGSLMSLQRYLKL
jgi:hypothetical protein